MPQPSDDWRADFEAIKKMRPGPGEEPEDNGIADLRAALDEKPVEVYKPGLTERAWEAIGDFVGQPWSLGLSKRIDDLNVPPPEESAVGRTLGTLANTVQPIVTWPLDVANAVGRTAIPDWQERGLPFAPVPLPMPYVPSSESIPESVARGVAEAGGTVADFAIGPKAGLVRMGARTGGRLLGRLPGVAGRIGSPLGGGVGALSTYSAATGLPEAIETGEYGQLLRESAVSPATFVQHAYTGVREGFPEIYHALNERDAEAMDEAIRKAMPTVFLALAARGGMEGLRSGREAPVAPLAGREIREVAPAGEVTGQPKFTPTPGKSEKPFVRPPVESEAAGVPVEGPKPGSWEAFIEARKAEAGKPKPIPMARPAIGETDWSTGEPTKQQTMFDVFSEQTRAEEKRLAGREIRERPPWEKTGQPKVGPPTKPEKPFVPPPGPKRFVATVKIGSQHQTFSTWADDIEVARVALRDMGVPENTTIRMIPKPRTKPPLQELKRAEEVRKDAGRVQEGGLVGQGREGESRADIQRAAEAKPEARVEEVPQEEVGPIPAPEPAPPTVAKTATVEQPTARRRGITAAQNNLLNAYKELQEAGEILSSGEMEAHASSGGGESLLRPGYEYTSITQGEGQALRDSLPKGTKSNVKILKPGQKPNPVGKTGEEVEYELGDMGVKDPQVIMARHQKALAEERSKINRIRRVVDYVQRDPEAARMYLSPETFWSAKVWSTFQDKELAHLASGKKPETIVAEKLKLGDEFEIAGEKYRVTQADQNSLTLQDGGTKEHLWPFQEITIDKGSLEKGNGGARGVYGQEVISERPMTTGETKPLLMAGEDVTVRPEAVVKPTPPTVAKTATVEGQPKLPPGKRRPEQGLPPGTMAMVSKPGKAYPFAAATAKNLGRKLYGALDRQLESINNGRQATLDIGKRIFLDVPEVIEKWGPTGRDLARGTRTVDHAATQHYNINKLDAEKALAAVRRHDLPSGERFSRSLTGDKYYSVHERMMMALNKRIPESDLPSDARAMLPKVREILNRDLLDAIDQKFERSLPSGEKAPIKGSDKPFPQVPNREGLRFLKEARQDKQTPRIATWAVKQVEAGRYQTPEKAIKALRAYADNILVGKNEYLSESRVELPIDMVKWEPNDVLAGHFQRNAVTLEAARQWGGQDTPWLTAQVDALREYTDAGTVRSIKEFYEINTGKAVVSAPTQKFFGAISNYESVVKLGLSVPAMIRNAGQPFANLVRYPLSIRLKAYKDIPPLISSWIRSAQEVRDQIARAGVPVYERTAISEMENVQRAVSTAVMTPYAKGETANFYRTARAAQLGIQRDIQKLKALETEGPLKRAMRAVWSLGADTEAALKRDLAKSGVNNLTNEQLADLVASGKMTSEQMAGAMYRVVSDTQFPLTLANKPLWWDRYPAARLLMKFKMFGVKQMKLMWRDVVKEARYGNIAPIQRFIIGTFLVGEIYNVARDMIVGDEQSMSFKLWEGRNDARTIGETILSNIVDGGGIGMVADLLFGIEDMVGGPTVSSLKNAANAVQHIVQHPKQWRESIAEFVKKDVAWSKQVSGATKRIEAALGKEEADEYLQLKEWRRRAYDFKAREKAQTIKEKTRDVLADVFSPSGGFDVTPRTLTKVLVRRAMELGEPKDAVGAFMAYVEDQKDPEEITKMWDETKRAAKDASPLASLTKDERRPFLRSLSDDNKKKIMALEKRFSERYKMFLREIRPIYKSALRRAKESTRKAA